MLGVFFGIHFDVSVKEGLSAVGEGSFWHRVVSLFPRLLGGHGTVRRFGIPASRVNVTSQPPCRLPPPGGGQRMEIDGANLPLSPSLRPLSRPWRKEIALRPAPLPRPETKRVRKREGE